MGFTGSKANARNRKINLTMKDILLEIISAIVDNPKAVEIKEEEQEGVTNFIVTVAKEDMG